MADLWLKASFATHSFHYRMPDTVAISSVNPALPSPLTVQMAMLASYLREGNREKAQALLDLTPLTLRIRPPGGAIIYRSLMRFVRPPRHADSYDGNTGSGYTISPHYREFALLEGNLEVYVQTNENNQQLIQNALELIPYLGTKDSLVTCLCIEPVELPPDDCAVSVNDADFSQIADYLVLQLADFADAESLHPTKNDEPSDKAISLEKLIPSQRMKAHYSLGNYLIKGRLSSEGNVKLFKRGEN